MEYVTEFMQNLQICKLRENLSANVIEKGRKSTVHLIVNTLALVFVRYTMESMVRYTMLRYTMVRYTMVRYTMESMAWIMILVPTALEYIIHHPWYIYSYNNLIIIRSSSWG